MPPDKPEKQITAYIVKYALTQGILVTVGVNVSGNMLRVTDPDCWPAYFHKNEWTTDPTEAIALAEKRRQAKIASVKKQLAELEAMTFPGVDELKEMAQEINQ